MGTPLQNTFFLNVILTLLLLNSLLSGISSHGYVKDNL